MSLKGPPVHGRGRLMGEGSRRQLGREGSSLVRRQLAARSALVPTSIPRYGAQERCRRKIEMTPGAQSGDDTRVGGGHDERDLDCLPAVRLSSDLIASADRD